MQDHTASSELFLLQTLAVYQTYSTFDLDELRKEFVAKRQDRRIVSP
jgi:hypothetical protein